MKSIQEFNRMSNFHEFVFARAIEEANILRFRNGGDLIKVRQGRELHQKVLDALPPQTKDFGKVSPANFRTLLNDILPLDAAESVDANLYSRFTQEYKNMTKTPESNRLEDASYFVVSPYDPKYAYRESIISGGANIQYAPLAPYFQNEVVNEADVRLLRNSNKGLVESGPMLTRADSLGLSRFRPYMSHAEYAKILMHNELGSYTPMSDSAADLSIALLDRLNSEGITYTIEPDQKPGQFIAKLDGTKIQVRLSDTRENEEFVGRVYDDGISYYYDTDAGRGADRALHKEHYKAKTAEDAFTLLQIARGESVLRRDKPDTLIGEKTTLSEAEAKRVSNRKNDSYYLASKAGAVFTADTYKLEGEKYSNRVLIRISDDRRGVQEFFTQELASEYLDKTVSAGLENVREEVNIDHLIDVVNRQKNGEDIEPNYSAFPMIRNLQEMYVVAMLTEESLSRIGIDEGPFATYDGDYNVQLEQHLSDFLEVEFGSIEHKTINPNRLKMFLDATQSTNDHFDTMIKAIKKSDEYTLVGSGDSKKAVENHLIKYDATTAKQMSVHHSDFVRTMGGVVLDTLKARGCEVSETDITIDAQGVIQYKGSRPIGDWYFEKGSKNPKLEEFSGTIGPLFVPEPDGLVKVEFKGSEGYYFAPGYEANVLPNKDGENLSMEERIRLVGYEQKMASALRYNISSDILSRSSEVDNSFGLNKLYKTYTEGRLPLDFRELQEAQGMDPKMSEAIVKTNVRSVRFNNYIKDGATIAQQQQAENKGFYQQLNDNEKSALELVGGKMISVIYESSDGYFDPILTGSGKNQGAIRYLAESAQVNADGSIIRGEMGDEAPISKTDFMRYRKHCPADRQQMAGQNLLKAQSSVSEPTGVAMVDLYGFTLEDGFVISKEFAESNLVRIVKDNEESFVEVIDDYENLSDYERSDLRPLEVGDKILDAGGNKGVINLIVDRNMSLEEAKEQNLEGVVKFFNNNPNLNVACAPYAPLGRFNATTAKVGMEKTENLVLNDGTVVEGGLYQAELLITDATVEKKTKLYDLTEEGVKGRSASSQLAWSLQADGCSEICRELWGGNVQGMRDMREYFISLGVDMDEHGNLKPEYTPHNGEERHVFETSSDTFIRKTNKKGEEFVDKKGMVAQFGKELRDKGGFMEVPFDLKFPNGETLQQNENGSYMLPVLSSNLRSETEILDGEVINHEYTKRYLALYETSLNTMIKAEQEGVSPQACSTYQSDMQKAKNLFGGLTNDIIASKIETKNNFVKQKVMSTPMKHAITAVITGDPRLDLDTISISTEMADTLGVENNESVLMFRDPQLRNSGSLGVKVQIVEGSNKASMNPNLAALIDGDFDGDTVGIARLDTPGAKRELATKKAVWNHMLDQSAAPDEYGNKPLLFQSGGDMASVRAQNPPMLAEYRELETLINKAETDEAKKEAFSKYNDYNKRALSMADKTYVNFKDPISHIDSLQTIVDSGAKGSNSKLEIYAKALGVTHDNDMDGRILSSTIKDTGESLLTRADQVNFNIAGAVKSTGTGFAGMHAQYAVAMLRNRLPKEALDATYPLTQKTLQGKHDPVEAGRTFKLTSGIMKDAWKGYDIKNIETKSGDTVWTVVRDEKGKPVQAQADKWAENMSELYRSEDGLNINVDPKIFTTIAKEAAKRDGFMRNYEKDTKLISVMDRLAYHPNKLETLYSSAKEGRNFYGGQMNELFAPKEYYRNDRALENKEVVSKVAAKDTQKVEKPKRDLDFSNVMSRPESELQQEARKRNAAYAKDLGLNLPEYESDSDGLEIC